MSNLQKSFEQPTSESGGTRDWSLEFQVSLDFGVWNLAPIALS
jgi:hypothetical protein